MSTFDEGTRHYPGTFRAMNLYVKVKNYELSQYGKSCARIVVKIHPFKMKLKAEITLLDGRTYELFNQWATEEEFDVAIENFVQSKF